MAINLVPCISRAKMLLVLACILPYVVGQATTASTPTPPGVTPTLAFHTLPTVTACGPVRISWGLANGQLSDYTMTLRIISDPNQNFPVVASVSSVPPTSQVPATSTSASVAVSANDLGLALNTFADSHTATTAPFAKRFINLPLNQILVTNWVASIPYDWNTVVLPRGRYYVTGALNGTTGINARTPTFSVIESQNRTCLTGNIVNPSAAVSSTTSASSVPTTTVAAASSAASKTSTSTSTSSAPTTSASSGAADTSSTTTKKGISGGAIAGIIIGVLALLIALLAIFLIRRRRNRNNRPKISSPQMSQHPRSGRLAGMGIGIGGVGSREHQQVVSEPNSLNGHGGSPEQAFVMSPIRKEGDRTVEDGEGHGEASTDMGHNIFLPSGSTGGGYPNSNPFSSPPITPRLNSGPTEFAYMGGAGPAQSRKRQASGPYPDSPNPNSPIVPASHAFPDQTPGTETPERSQSFSSQNGASRANANVVRTGSKRRKPVPSLGPAAFTQGQGRDEDGEEELDQGKGEGRRKSYQLVPDLPLRQD